MLHFERTGVGHPLVLIHGYLGSRQIFDEVIHELATYFDCIRVELPGHGDSEVELEAYSIYDYANEIAHLLRKENIESCYMLGHSLGGYITLEAYAKNLVQIDKMVLAYTSEKADNEEAKAKRDLQRETVVVKGVSNYVDGIIENFFAPNTDPAIIDKARAIAKSADSLGLMLALEAMKNRPDQTDLLPKINIPVLVIEGTEDKIVKPIETTNDLFEKAYTTTGHLGMLEDPPAFVNAVIHFLRK